MVWCSFGGACVFLSTLSLRRATRGISSGIAETAIFYPRSPCGERPFRLRSFLDLVLFLSTLSLRRATYDTYAKVLRVNFSIHALLAESDASHTNSPSKIINFLSTLSLRRATTAPRTGLTCGGGFFYPRSPCGERPWQRGSRITYVEFSIHALLAESDISCKTAETAKTSFLSTLSLRRATANNQTAQQEQHVFYPRSPCGERLLMGGLSCERRSFLSTLSLRRATAHYDNYNLHCVFSIHALLAESDPYI